MPNRVIVGTAGHIDHGKSAPGAADIDIVMLVIAADEGVMPQTREHLDICRLLSVRDGIVVLTKCDKVDADWAALQEEEGRTFVRGTFLSAAPLREPSRGGKGERAARVGPVPPWDACPHEGGRCASRIPAPGCEAAEEPGACFVPRGGILFPREDPPLRRRGDFSRRIGGRAGRTRRGSRPQGGGPVHPARLLPPRKFRLHRGGRTDPSPLPPPPQGGGKTGPAGVALVTVSRGGGPGPGSPGRGRAERARDERGRRHRRGWSCRGRRGKRGPPLIRGGSGGYGGTPGTAQR